MTYDWVNDLRVFSAKFPPNNENYDFYSWYGNTTYLVVTVDWTQAGEWYNLTLVFKKILHIILKHLKTNTLIHYAGYRRISWSCRMSKWVLLYYSSFHLYATCEIVDINLSLEVGFIVSVKIYLQINDIKMMI